MRKVASQPITSTERIVLALLEHGQVNRKELETYTGLKKQYVIDCLGRLTRFNYIVRQPQPHGYLQYGLSQLGIEKALLIERQLAAQALLEQQP